MEERRVKEERRVEEESRGKKMRGEERRGEERRRKESKKSQRLGARWHASYHTLLTSEQSEFVMLCFAMPNNYYQWSLKYVIDPGRSANFKVDLFFGIS